MEHQLPGELLHAQAIFGQGACSSVEHSGHLQLPGPRAGTRCPGQAPVLQEAAFPSRVLCAGRQRHQDPLFLLNCKLFNWKGTMGKNKCAQVDFHV